MAFTTTSLAWLTCVISHIQDFLYSLSPEKCPETKKEDDKSDSVLDSNKEGEIIANIKAPKETKEQNVNEIHA